MYTRVNMAKAEWPGWWKVIALSSTIFAVEFAYSVEAGYATPTLLKTGLQERYATLMWSVSPVLGILFQSYLGSASDKCTCCWGRRRPFIVSLGVVCVLALCLFPYGADVGSNNPLVLVAYTVVVFVAMDFCLDAIQSPCRSYLLDSLSKERNRRGNLIYTIMMELGATLGGLFGAIPWKRFGGKLGDSFEAQTKIVFGVTTGLFLVSLIFTILSVNENKTRALREGISEKAIDTSCKCGSLLQSLKDFYASIREAVLFVKNMSYRFFVLWMFSFLGYFTATAFYLFFTEYVGSVIYGGVANSDDEELKALYDEGVLMGCGCLTLCSGSSFVFSVSVDYALEHFDMTLKYFSLYSFLVHLAVLGAALVYPNLITAMLVAISSGLLYTVLGTVSFTLASDFERNGLILRTEGKSVISKVGMTVSFLFIALFVAQFLLGISLGNLIQLFGTSQVIIVVMLASQLMGTIFLVCNLNKFSET